ncbi:hypothetical protein HS088_TW04G00069 [Tripterygium wilfordii]|uniref:Transmembrane 9 superfamily member n=1 Tax=Tripterygium wilfordii TaxID=458696 RepID=A0A7J7DPB3_TRIWF|nr:hypothetical protein HS088_TW04G00069 [Tripterygium wilfordii]
MTFQIRSLSLYTLTVAAVLLALIHGGHSFYLPGVAPQDFEKGDKLLVKVNKLTSTKTQLPYSYYSLPYCRPKKIIDSAENLGEVLRGDRIENSPYVFKMREPQMCKIVCRIALDAKTTKEFKEKIDDEYRVNMILDNLPLVVPIKRSDQESPGYQLGYYLGLKGQYSGSKVDRYFINNHLAFTVKYHKDLQSDPARIVGFEVKSFSVKHEYEGNWNDDKTRLITCDPHAKHMVVNSNSPQEVEEKKEIIFTYDVEFVPSDVKWASRWDAYLLMSDDQIHWTAIMFPGIVSAIFFVLNALIWGEKSSGAVPFGTMFALVFLWFGISVPLVFVGSYVGFRKPAIEDPVKTNKIPRQIPAQAWYMNPAFSILIGGILPFGAVFIELFFILTSIWLNQFYYIFGFLFLVFIILLVTCAEITIVLCYFQLCSEDYLWWWRSYLTSGSSAVYLFLYATFYFFTKLEITKFVSGVLYFGYMLIASYAFFVLTGTIGFYACFWFTRLIYSSVKID